MLDLLARQTEGDGAPVTDAGRGLSHVLGWALFASDVLGRAHALAPLAEEDLEDLALWGEAGRVSRDEWRATQTGAEILDRVRHPDPSSSHAARVDLRPQDASTWRNPRVVTRAVRFLQDKRLLTPAEFAALADQYRVAAFSIAGVTERVALEAARDALRASVEAQATLGEATGALEAALDAKGFTRLRPWHARLVAHMAHATGYGAGQDHVLGDRRLRGILPAVRWVTAADDRVRETHAAMDGHTAARGAEIWKVWRSPAGYNCRCRRVGVPARAWSRASAPWPLVGGRRVQPDEGFRGGGTDYVGEQVPAEVRRYVQDVTRIARKLPAGYDPGPGWQVTAVFGHGRRRSEDA